MTGRIRRAGIGAVREDEARESDQARRGLAAIALEVVQARHRIVVEIEDPGIDQVDQRLPRQAELDDGVVERRRHGIGPHIAPRLALQGVAPPLQADLADDRLAHGLANAGDLEVEGIEREEMRPLVGRREEARPVAIRIGVAHEGFAMGEV